MKLLASRDAIDAAGVVAAMVQRLKGQWPARDFFERDRQRLWDELVAGDWLALGTAEADGGAGLELLDLAAIVEAWGRHLVPLPYVPTMLLRRWCPGIVADHPGDRLTYSLPAPRGTAGLAPYAGVAGTRLVASLAPTSVGGGSLASPGAEDGGASWAPSLPLVPTAAPTASLPGHARREIAVLAAAELLGCGAAVLDQALAYAKERQQFGQAIAEFQGVAHRLANMHRDLEVARTALVWCINEPEHFDTPVAVAWDRIRAMTEECIQIHGGYGFTWEAGLHFYVRHVWAWARLLDACGVRSWPT